MSDNTIYEISQLMKSPESLNNDIATALSLIEGHFKNKYIKPIQASVENHLKICSHNPSQEVLFLRACKPFISSGGTDIFQKILNFYNVFEALQSITKEYNSNFVTTAQIQDPAIHSDGIYEVDKSCVMNASVSSEPVPTDLLFISLALLLILKNQQ